MPVTATAWLRPMRGGSQTHLLHASDGHHYVVKVSNNPQGLRTLVNEWLAQRILAHLQIPCPPVEIVEIQQAFLEANPDLNLKLGGKIIRPQPGWHFGSRYPGDPNLITVFDLLPDLQLLSCRNQHHFAAVLAFDKWTANSDSRQCIFYRARLADILAEEESDASPLYATRGLVASMIDHGFCFNSVYWDFPDAAGHGLYYRPVAYGKIRSWDAFEPWLERIKTFPESVLDRAIREIPQAWLPGTDESALQALCEKLLRRRGRVADLIEATRSRYPSHFSSWR